MSTNWYGNPFTLSRFSVKIYANPSLKVNMTSMLRIRVPGRSQGFFQ